jgi:2-polyprenyl-3-methyl-5-hydroxy-6-metoxy-1,4-benzoquinol methylase
MTAIFSFVLDDHPRFAYEAWHLARSLVMHCGGNPSAIHVQCTPEVKQHERDLFRDLGCRVHQIERFGDGRHCNKISQLQNLTDIDFDQVVLLDTDMIAIADVRPYLSRTAIRGKIVDMPNPPLATLREIADAAGLANLPPICGADALPAETYLGNCNGGFYSVPKGLCETLSTTWRRTTLWLLDNIEPLQQVRRQVHVDQVSFWLAIQQAELPFEPACSNVNYYVHFNGQHRYFDPEREIAVLHYHAGSFNVLGLLEPPVELSVLERAAIKQANEQVADGFDNRVFWDLRYSHFPKRGSGVGSRGDNAIYKRGLLQDHGVETVGSVLDVGCGDLEVVKTLDIRNYVGIDQSPCALEVARQARPDWRFCLGFSPDLQSADMVLCLEVLIHQKTAGAYHALVDFIAQKTLGSLLVSGFASNDASIDQNPMIFFHEPLETSLGRTRRFGSIREIGKHTNVIVYRCDV